jgi:hypothetical protein
MRYETAEDIKNEEEVIKLFAKKGNFEYKKLNQHSLDFALLKNDIVKCFVEVKCFKSRSNQYPTQVVSLIKFDKMLDYSKLAPVYFVCRYSDNKIMYIKSEDIKGSLMMFRRTIQRIGNTDDSEIVVHVERSKFKEL